LARIEAKGLVNSSTHGPNSAFENQKFTVQSKIIFVQESEWTYLRLQTQIYHHQAKYLIFFFGLPLEFDPILGCILTL
jgi:hypothetical protein